MLLYGWWQSIHRAEDYGVYRRTKWEGREGGDDVTAIVCSPQWWQIQCEIFLILNVY